jgi:drug/metabolite transporter (DMT)-like permease
MDGEGAAGAERATALAVAGAACISTSAVFVALANVGPATTAFYRCLIALPPLVLLAWYERRRLGPRSSARRLRALLAGPAFAVDLVLWNHAIGAVGAGVATVLGNLQVLFVALAAWALFKEKPSRRVATSLPIVGFGVVLVAGVLGGSHFGHHPVAGIVYGVGTSIAYAVFLLVMKSAATEGGHVAGPLTDATASAAVSVLVLGAAFGGLKFSLPGASLFWLTLLALLPQVVGWMLITSSLPRLPSAMSSLLLLLQPALAMLLAAAILSQYPTVWQDVGAAFVCSGVLFAAWKPGAAVESAEGRDHVGHQPHRRLVERIRHPHHHLPHAELNWLAEPPDVVADRTGVERVGCSGAVVARRPVLLHQR